MFLQYNIIIFPKTIHRKKLEWIRCYWCYIVIDVTLLLILHCYWSYIVIDLTLLLNLRCYWSYVNLLHLHKLKKTVNFILSAATFKNNGFYLSDCGITARKEWGVICHILRLAMKAIHVQCSYLIFKIYFVFLLVVAVYALWLPP